MEMQAMVSSVSIASLLPGRVRIRLPDAVFQGAREQFGELGRSVKGVISVRLANLAGSLVVEYDPKQTHHGEIVACVSRTLDRVSPEVDAVPAPLPSEPRRRRLFWGITLLAIGILLFIIPGVPGIPILLIALEMLH